MKLDEGRSIASSELKGSDAITSNDWFDVWRQHRQLIIISSIIIFPVLIATIYYGARIFASPTKLSIGLLAESPELKLFETLAPILERENAKIRLDIKVMRDASAIGKSLQSDKLDFAVLRSERSFPTNAQSLVILRATEIVIMTLDKKVDDIRDIIDLPIGVMSNEVSDLELIKQIVSHFNSPAKPILFESVATASEALKANKVSALAFLSGEGMRRLPMRELTKFAGNAVKFVGVSDGDGVAFENPGFSSSSIPAKSFSSRPPLPAEELKTLKVESRLVATEKVDRNLVAALTERLFKHRIEIARTAPSVNLIKTIDNDYVTSSLFPVHVGALDYFRREQMSFYERYNDIIWLVILYGGSLISGIGWLGQRAIAGRRREQLDLLDQLVQIWSKIDQASSSRDLLQILTSLDLLIVQTMMMTRDGKLSHRRLAAVTLGESRARELIQKKLLRADTQMQQ